MRLYLLLTSFTESAISQGEKIVWAELSTLSWPVLIHNKSSVGED